MNDPEFELLDRVESTQWWFVGKRAILRALLRDLPPGQRMLDPGCGTGGILRDWAAENHCFGIDRSDLALRLCAKQGFHNLARGDLQHVPVKPASMDTVLLMDVIEHLEDDVGLLRVARALCVPGGRLVIAVPAFQLLWSQHDVTFEHHRRYSKRRLLEVVRAATLEPERTTYTNSLLFPVALVWRVVAFRLGAGRFARKHDFWPIPGWLNSLLAGLDRIEARLLERFDLPVGVSVVCIARRPG